MQNMRQIQNWGWNYCEDQIYVWKPDSLSLSFGPAYFFHPDFIDFLPQF
jgi:hypothetical protein